MSDVVKRLRERREQVWSQAKEIADRAADENRALSGEEEGQWQQMNSELDALDKRIQNVIDGEQRAKDTEEKFAQLRGEPEKKTPEGEARKQSGDEFRAFLRGERGRVYDVLPSGPIDFRDLTKGTATAGGNTVPTDFFTRLVEHMIETSAILRAGATVLNTAGGEDLQVPKTTGHSSASIVTEGSAITESDSAFGQTVLGAHKYGILIQVSRELLNDTGVDIEGYLSRQAGRALGNGFGADAVTGDTTGSQPKGLATRATVGVTAASGGFEGDDIIDLKFSVIEPYRRSGSAAWLMQDATTAAVRKLKDNNGQYLWQPALTAGEPDILLGHPVVTDPFVDSPNTTGNRPILFGDISAYFARLAGGVRFERSDEYAFNTDLVTFRALLRADGDLVDQTGAVKALEHG